MDRLIFFLRRLIFKIFPEFKLLTNSDISWKTIKSCKQSVIDNITKFEESGRDFDELVANHLKRLKFKRGVYNYLDIKLKNIL